MLNKYYCRQKITVAMKEKLIALTFTHQHFAKESVMDAINLNKKLDLINDYWSPKIISSFNDNDVMLVKVKGEFVWHSHEDTDDFFLLLKGKLRIETENGPVDLNEGELHVVPRGISHRPVATEEAHILLIEPKGTPNTGDPDTAAKKTAF